ncbi:DUF882 domain-containing protein [Pseudohoeflea sp. DP4N28-3]|uniref:DUF882 domain-containing protein n=2 Tax=Pseudohoeflea coraliihabitans TaxID=2860393 RepID=A0ABS6WPH7_9HYPH|nr:DUF882 domain-containing protein [Pseudohoeflea sp. DP4N28-3]
MGFWIILAGLAVSAVPATAQAETRSLKLYYTHTNERAEIVFKRNGRYDRAGLKKLNRFLRDWRRNEPTEMDPRLFDLIWEVYRQTGARDYVHVVSAYRSPATNEMLRRTRGGQAKKSQHMLGKAMDFYIPGVKLSKLRAVAMKLQGGGVGYYPKSGSPFVHLDVASVRAWPRMSRQELVQLFPDGKTLHLPPDGKRLPGYSRALAEYKARGGAIASSGGSSGRSGGGNLLAALFGGSGDEDEEPTPSVRPAAPQVQTAAVAAAPQEAGGLFPPLPQTAPVPASRPAPQPAAAIPVTETALVAPPANLPAEAQVNAFAAAAAAVPQDPVAASAEVFPDLDSLRVPVPQLLAERSPRPPRPDDAGTEVAALAPADADAVTSPAVAATLSAPSDTAASDTGTEVAAFVPLPIRRPGDVAPAASSGEAGGTAAPAVASQSTADEPVQVAALSASEDADMRRMATSVPNGGRIVSAFASGIAPRKGGRPGVADANKGQVVARTAEPKLTEKIISRWAMGRQRSLGGVHTDDGGQRFIASQLQEAPAEVYAAGFTRGGGDLPHDRFTGTAVNFMQVARFGPSS